MIPSDPNAHKFPGGDIEGYDQAAGQTFGAITPNSLNYYSNSLNGTFSRFFGTHTIKVGGDYRKVGADFFSPGDGSGFFNFDKAFTSADPRSDGTATSGSSFASFLLGTDRRSDEPQYHAVVDATQRVFEILRGVHQDDWRVRPNFTLNYGLRIEHEDGMREQDDRITVGFDANAVSPLNVTIPADPVAGAAARQVKGGLLYAGQNGANDFQGNPPRRNGRRESGRVFVQQQDRAPRRVWHLLGAVELPAAKHRDKQLRPDGLHGEHPDTAKPVHSHGDAGQSISQRAGAAGGQFAGIAGGRGYHHPLRRPEQRRAARAAVLSGSAA